MKKRTVFLREVFMVFFVLFLSFVTLGQSAVVPMLPVQGICAHRGAMGTHPENTIAAFQEAIRLGAQMIELDVRLTKDNALIIMHDETVDRTTNGTGFVQDLTLSEIRKLDAGSWKATSFAGERVPTLKDVLQLMPPTIWLNIHLKGTKKLGVETAKLVSSEKRQRQSVFACERQAAKGVRKVGAGLKICTMERLSSRQAYIEATKKKGYPFIQLKKSRETGTLKTDVAYLLKNGITVNYVQADEVKELPGLLNMGVAFIFTDDLGPMVDAYRNYTVLRKN